MDISLVSEAPAAPMEPSDACEPSPPHMLDEAEDGRTDGTEDNRTLSPGEHGGEVSNSKDAVPRNKLFKDLLPRCCSPVSADRHGEFSPLASVGTPPSTSRDPEPDQDQDADEQKESSTATQDTTVLNSTSGLNFSTFGQAIAEAGTGDVILLQPGCYHEKSNIHLTQDGITVRNCPAPEGSEVSGSNAEIVFDEGCGLVCSGSGVKFEGIHFQQMKSKEVQKAASETSLKNPVACIKVTGGDANFDACVVVSPSSTGFSISGNARPTVKNCVINRCHHVAVLCRGSSAPYFQGNTMYQNVGFSVYITDDCTGEFVENMISETGKCAILCSGKSASKFVRNTVSDGTQGGFWIQSSSTCILEENTIQNNHKAALQISDQSNPTVKRNKILDGDGGGIVVHGKATGTYIGNTLSGSVRAGIGIMDDACPIFIGNEMLTNEGGGAVMAGRSEPVFIANKINGNGFVGIGVKESSSPFLQDNQIGGNLGYGILAQGASSPTIQECTIENNKRSGVCACENAVVIVSHCMIQATDDVSQRAGLLLHDCSNAVMMHSTVRNHRTGNVVMQDRSAGTLTGNHLTSAVVGVKLHANAVATLRQNLIEDGAECNVLVLNSAQLRASGNQIVASRGSGVRAVQSSQCNLNHNTIMNNKECGVRAEGSGTLEMRANRVSGNAGDGVNVESVSVKMKANVIFENANNGLSISNISAPYLCGNTIFSGSANLEAAAFVTKNVSSLTACTGNVVQHTTGSLKVHSPSSFLVSNIGCKDPKTCKAAVDHGLDVLTDWTQHRQKHTVVLQPDGREWVCQPATHVLKALVLPVPK